jgi:hypothetical protein
MVFVGDGVAVPVITAETVPTEAVADPDRSPDTVALRLSDTELVWVAEVVEVITTAPEAGDVGEFVIVGDTVEDNVNADDCVPEREVV